MFVHALDVVYATFANQKSPLTYNNDMVALLNKDVGSNVGSAYLILEFTLRQERSPVKFNKYVN